MKYGPHELPNFVKEWFGGYKIQIVKMTDRTWLFIGIQWSVIVNAESSKEARKVVSLFVGRIDGRRDKRRAVTIPE